MKDWMIGLLIVAALPVVWSWFKKELANLPFRIVDGMKKGYAKRLEEGKVKPNVDRLLRKIGVAFAEFVEAELPDEGLGEERMKLAIDTLCGLPFGLGRLFTLARSKDEAKLREGIEILVKAMDEEARKEKEGR